MRANIRVSYCKILVCRQVSKFKRVTLYKCSWDMCHTVRHFLLHVSHGTEPLITCVKMATCRAVQKGLWRLSTFACGTVHQISSDHSFTCHTVRRFFDTCPYWQLLYGSNFVQARVHTHVSHCLKFILARVHVGSCYSVQNVWAHLSRWSRGTLYNFLVEARFQLGTCVSAPFFIWHVYILTDFARWNFSCYLCRLVAVHLLKMSFHGAPVPIFISFVHVESTVLYKRYCTL